MKIRILLLSLTLIMGTLHPLIAEHLPEAEHTDTFYKSGNTNDIMDAIAIYDRLDVSNFKEFSDQFGGDIQGYRDFHDFLIENIQYVADPAGEQLIKTPIRGLRDGEGDCKLYALCIGWFAQCKGHYYEYECTSYNLIDPTPTHIYTTVRVQGKTISIDPVLTIHPATDINGVVPISAAKQLLKTNNQFGNRKFYFHRTILKGSNENHLIAGFKNNLFRDLGVTAAVGTGLYYGGRYLYNTFWRRTA